MKTKHKKETTNNKKRAHEGEFDLNRHDAMFHTNINKPRVPTYPEALPRGARGRRAAMKRFDEEPRWCSVCYTVMPEEEVTDLMQSCAPTNHDDYPFSELWDEGFCGRMCCYDPKCWKIFVANEGYQSGTMQCKDCVKHFFNPLQEYDRE